MTLTNRGRAILTAIADHTAEHGYPPTQHEMQELAGISSISVVANDLSGLRRGGYVTYIPMMGRTYVLTDAGRAAIEEGS